MKRLARLLTELGMFMRTMIAAATVIALRFFDGIPSTTPAQEPTR